MPARDGPLPAPVVVGVAALLTLLLSTWAAFLVPLRPWGVPLPVWALPLGGMLAIAVAAARRAGLAGALVPALVWLPLTTFAFGATRREGDLVVPGTTAGTAYLYGGMLAWAVVVLRASSADRRPDRYAPDGPPDAREPGPPAPSRRAVSPLEPSPRGTARR